ncbi:threonine aldolase family protein [Aminobacter sp. Piv2-1]|uniref:threonine aldolase family protein n=1 Tax=Aminobacter sp. Piv2-1 TaxID=3031122 RepID=UPI003098E435
MAQAFIDLYSDTKSLPTDGMRKAMMTAVVGDEQKDEDPTVLKLCERVADLLGKEAAVFMPSGTMCNEAAVAVHCRPGDELICDRTAHILNSETGAPAAISGVTIYPIDTRYGIFDRVALRKAIRPDSRYIQPSRLVVVEQTSNFGGGRVWPIETIDEVVDEARQAGLKLHMDGARLLNAQIASGISAKRYAEKFDSAWIDLSKGLGAPVGGVLAGERDFVKSAWRVKQRLGGAMRQAGFLAAAGLYALDNHVDRIAEDHEHAKMLAIGLSKIEGIRVNPDDIETNIVFFDVAGTGMKGVDFVARLKAQGVGMGAFGETTIRAIPFIGHSRDDIQRAIDTIAQLVQANIRSNSKVA